MYFTNWVVNLPSPSPNPNSTRQNINAGTDVAKRGVIEVDTDHRNTANKRTAFPPNLLAAQAPMTCNAGKPEVTTYIRSASFTA
jgi:hypothetical protein